MFPRAVEENDTQARKPVAVTSGAN
jgi:hypothetical protein